MMFLLRVSCGLLVATTFLSSAHAVAGDHLRAGDAIITPEVDIGFEYRSNLYHRENAPLGGVNARVAPSITVNLNAPQTEFELSGVSQLRYQIAKPSSNTRNLSRFSDFNIGTGLRLLQGQTLGFTFSESVGLQNAVAQAQNADNTFTTHFRNDFASTAQVKLGPVFDLGLTGRWSYDNWSLPTVTPVSERVVFNGRQTFGPELEFKWTFFPRTALVFDGEYHFNSWNKSIINTTGGTSSLLGTELLIPNSQFAKSLLGLRGRFSPKSVLVVQAGYGMGRYSKDGADGTGAAANISKLRHLLVLTQLTYDFSGQNKLSVGYRRDFSDSWFTNYMAYDHLYANVNSQLSKRLSSDVQAGIRSEAYRGQYNGQDYLVRVKGDLTYYFQDFASVNGGVFWTERASPTNPLREYDDFEVHVLVNISY